jgi:hypothetical protein
MIPPGTVCPRFLTRNPKEDLFPAREEASWASAAPGWATTTTSDANHNQLARLAE